MASTTLPTTTWWVTALAGVFSILFGLIALLWPGLTLMILVWLFGIYAIVYGIVNLVGMFRAMGAHTPWWPHLLIGVISIIAGIAVFAWPMITTVVLLYVIAFWALFLGIVEIVGGLFRGHFLMMLMGVITVVFGFIMLANPGAGALALIMVIGIFAIVRGILELVAAARMPEMAGTTKP